MVGEFTQGWTSSDADELELAGLASFKNADEEEEEDDDEDLEIGDEEDDDEEEEDQ
jgi:hypothetical protein